LKSRRAVGDIIFNPDISGTIGAPGGTLDVSVTDNLGNVVPFDYTLSNGSNFLTVTTTGGEQIVSTSLSYSLDMGFTDLRKIRISGASGTVIPEPAAVTMLGTRLAMIAVFGFRRSHHKRCAELPERSLAATRVSGAVITISSVGARRGWLRPPGSGSPRSRAPTGLT
jgi:hypothetical protein